jgi:hypothetical protein
MKKRLITKLSSLIFPIGFVLAFFGINTLLIFRTTWDVAVKFAAMGSLAAALGLCVSAYIGSIALLQFMQSQRRPDLNLVFADSFTTTTTIQIPMEGEKIYDIPFAIINDGNTVAIWFEVMIDISNLPWGFSCWTEPWVQENSDDDRHHFNIRNFGKAAAFTSSPLKIGMLNVVTIKCDEQASRYKIPYQINGDWGAPKKGELLLIVEQATRS